MRNEKEQEEVIGCYRLLKENKFSDNILYLKENLLKYENILFKEKINDKENLNCKSNHNINYKNIPEICEKSFLSNDELVYYHHFIQKMARKIVMNPIYSSLDMKMQIGHLTFYIQSIIKNELLCPLCFHHFYEHALERIDDSIKEHEERIRKDIISQNLQKLKKNYKKINRRKINSKILKLYRNINKKKKEKKICLHQTNLMI